MGDNINISAGGSVIATIKATLNNVTNSISVLPSVDQTVKEDLIKQVDSLSSLLQTLPVEKVKDGELLTKRVNEAVEEAKKPKTERDTDKAQFNLTSMLQIAGNIANILPKVLPVVEQIANHIQHIIL